MRRSEESGAVEDGLRRTPTWRAKCRITVSGRPLRFELWGARGDRALYLSISLGSKLLQEQHKRHRVYTGSGHHCGVIPYSSVVGGLPLGLMMKNSTRKNDLARVYSLLGDELLGGVRSPFSLSLDAGFYPAHSNLYLSPTLGVAGPIYRPRPWASSQILSGKGANNWPILRGTSGTLILTKVGPHLPKALW